MKSSGTFTPDSNLKQDYTYDYDLAGNIISITSHHTDSGIPNTPDGKDKLKREFEYDALYRLLNATGRETQTYTSQNPQAIQNHIQDQTLVNGYKEEYDFDKMGNILELIKTQTTPSSASRYKRVFNYTSNKTPLQVSKTAIKPYFLASHIMSTVLLKPKMVIATIGRLATSWRVFIMGQTYANIIATPVTRASKKFTTMTVI